MESASTEFVNSYFSSDSVVQAVKADFQCLLKQFYTCGSLEFPYFASIWSSMKMSMISAGRITDREARQFTEECLLIIVTYFLPQHNFESKTGAFYLMYSFYVTQPVIPKSKIRITIKDWVALNSFIEEAISKNLHDVEFIFHKLCSLKAFLYVAPPNEISQDQCIIDPSDDNDAYMDKLFNQNTTLETIFSNDNIEQLSAVHNQYQEMKCILSGIEMPSPDSSVNMLDVNTATVISDLIQTFKNESQYPGMKQTDQNQKKEVNKSTSKKMSKDSTSASQKNEVRTEEIAETSSASISLQVEMSSEDEDNCDVYYQVGDENDLIINENNDDQLVVDNMQN